jgi:hypothetical protein
MIPERLRLFRTIPHYVTNQPNSQNAGALGLRLTDGMWVMRPPVHQEGEVDGGIE